MNALILHWEKILKRNPLGEKILIVSAYSEGRQLIESCTRQGLKILNLKINTLVGLAQEITQNLLYKTKQTLIPETLAQELLIQNLRSLSTQGKLTYFNALEITPGISRVIYKAILELKMAGFTAEKVKPNLFINPAKGEDLIQIWQAYESELKKRRHLDQPDLFRLAFKHIPPFSCTWIVPSNLRLSSVERNFLRALTKDNFEVIDFGTPKGIPVPQGSIAAELTARTKENTPFSPLLWLYDLSGAPAAQDIKVEMFHSYGESNEIREVLRRIKKRDLAWDQAAVYYTSPEPYTYLLQTIAEEFQIPVTYGQGIDIRSTNPGRLFFGILDWAARGFQVSDFVPLIVNGVIKISGENGPSQSAAAHLLRTSGIGWGQERYLSVINKEIDALANFASINNEEIINEEINNEEISYKAESQAAEPDFGPDTGADLETEGEGERNYEHKRMNDLLGLRDFFTGLFAALPGENSEGRLPYGKLAGWVLDLVNHYSPVFNTADGEAKKVIGEELRLLEELWEELSPDEAYDRLAAVIEGRRVNASSPQPGCLHVDHYKAGIWITRPHVFVVGLDANRFPGAVSEDPILLDKERKNFGSGLPLLGLRPKEKTYDLVQSLGSVAETLTVSYSAFDPVENRPVFPAALLLQMHRLLSRDDTLDYSHLVKALGDRKGFIPAEAEDALGETEWWLNRLALGMNSNLDFASFTQLYPAFHDGIQAEIARQGPELTSYDGITKIDRDRVDPTLNHDLVMSCSQLENLAKCPYGYFLRYVLHVKPVEELLFDPSIWLDAKTKGELYHTIFEKFYRDLAAKGETPELAKHENALYEVAEDLVAAKKEEVPPPSDWVFEKERRAILDSCRVFLKSEEGEAQAVKPKFFELNFGLPGENEGFGPFEAVLISLPREKHFYLRGRIDRVDETPEGFKIWDYKTGSTYGYSDNKYFQGGRQLQHGLYALALERLLAEKGLSDKAKVIESGYLFPTLKGEGKRVVRQQIRRDSLYEILEQLFSLLAQGTFVLTNDANDCNICDFKAACNRACRSKEALAKMMVDSFRRLRSYA